MSIIEVFTGLKKSPKYDLGYLISPHISIPLFFKHLSNGAKEILSVGWYERSV